MDHVPVIAGEAAGARPPAAPRPAATVIVLRDGARTPEVLLVRRNPRARFMGGAWVFPGGAVHPGEGEGEPGARAAAVRELEEEAGIRVDPGSLVPWSRWITPDRLTVRFDTWFYAVGLPPGERPRVDGAECVALAWRSPAAALADYDAGRLLLVFPTIRTLEQLCGLRSAAAALEHARGRDLRPVQPRVVGSGSQARVVLDGEPGRAPAPSAIRPG